MAALHFIGFNFKVGHAFGPCAFTKREVAVGLESLRVRRIWLDVNEAGIHAAGSVSHGSLEQ